MNRFIMAGEISSEPIMSHETHGETMYKMNIDVMRKSGCVDALPCVIPEVLVSDTTIKGNKMSFEFLSCDKVERTIELEKVELK